MFGFNARTGLASALAAVCLAAGPAAAVTQDNFKLRTGTDIVQLCSVPVDDPLFVAAIHMCHGFGVSSYQTLAAINEHEKIGGFFCPPEGPPVTRNQAVADFLVWAKQPQNATYLNDSPAALVGRYLLTKYPCPKPVAGGGGR
jgi:Rap1a immunity proteins